MSLIELIKYILLGLIQGITKVLPVSSSGHVVIFQHILNVNFNNSDFFLVLLNFGSLVAVLIYFRKMIIDIIVKAFNYIFKKDKTEDDSYAFNYLLMVVVASIPVAIFGFYLQNVFLHDYFDKYSLIFVGVGSLIGATFLYIVRDGANQHVRQQLNYKDAIIIGLLQPFSVLPGLSRFALTTSTGLLRKLSMDTALIFSMFLYIPISLGSVAGYIYGGISDSNSFNLGINPIYWYHYVYYFIGFVTSIFATYYAIKWVFIFFRRGKLMIFAIYSMVLGFIALIFGLMAY